MYLIYGPPASGKTTLGKKLARALKLPFYDLDAEIENRSGLSIPDIFGSEGESVFRTWEHTTLATLLRYTVKRESVIALGGGALLNPDTRQLAESHGKILLLTAPPDILLRRLADSPVSRPLLQADSLHNLIAARAEHYASFPLQVDASRRNALREMQIKLGAFHVLGMGRGYDVRIVPNGLDSLGKMLRARGLGGDVALVSDENVAALYGARALESLRLAGYRAQFITFPPGERSKTPETVARLWDAFVQMKLDRAGVVVALGGGVTGDLAGFAASTYLRGVDWVAAPTSVLAMADAALGGKTGVNLPQGKNLVGAFHPPRLVLADPLTLDTLPEREFRAGLAEVIKAGLIGDARLFNYFLSHRRAENEIRSISPEMLARAMAVKIGVIEKDPYEQTGARLVLNLGHTLGHALEVASGYTLLHGEAVSIGLVFAAQTAERLRVARCGLAEQIADVLTGLGLPVSIPGGVSSTNILNAMLSDKKRAAGKIKFILPARVGKVVVRSLAPEELL
jgi:shikimate kinase / 3-dehydroquinate synthase